MHYSPDKYTRIGEHNVLLPPMPTDRRSILFHECRKEDQFWDRTKLVGNFRQIWYDFIPQISRSELFTRMYQPATLYDQDGLLISLNEEDSKYIDATYLQERDRRVNGIWFFNDGEPTHVTGDHYYFLMYARMQRHDGSGLFADYREFQADYFRLIHHCNVSPHILGLFASKPKKTGITNAHWSGYYLNKSTLYRNKNLGYMNINQGQAAKTFEDYFMYAYNGLISPIKPEIKRGPLATGHIVFGKWYGGSKKKRKPNAEDEDDINTSVTCVPTKSKAFDVAVMSDITFDEPTKYPESFGEIWRTNKEAVKIQSKINGKAWLFNYTEGIDTTSFREAREVFLDSELKTITKDSKGQTKTGLICYHIPAYAAWEGAINKYGKCNEKQAMAENNVERAKVAGNKRALQSTIRQYANNKREAWGSAGGGTTFDNIRLGDLLGDIEIDNREDVEDKYISGKLEWVNPLYELGLKNKRRKGEFCKVKLIPLTGDERSRGKEGRMRFFKQINIGQQNISLSQGRDENGCLNPPKRFTHIGGFDPTNYAAGSEVIEGSKNGGYILSVPDEVVDARFGSVETGVIVCEYFDRSELPEESFEDFLKMIIYYGALVIIEGNASYVATRMLEEGLGNYMFVRDENGNITPWKRWMGLPQEPEKKYSLIRITSNSALSKDMLEALVRVIKNYIEKPEDGAKDYGKTIQSERLLRQLMDFEPENTRLYDLVMAFGWMLLAKEFYTDYLLNPPQAYSEEEIGSILRVLW